MGVYGSLGSYGSLGVYGSLGGSGGGGATWGDPATWGGLETWWSVDSGGEGAVTKYFLRSPVRERGWVDGSAYPEITWHLSGATVVKRGGVWRTVRNKRQDWLDACDVVLRGGYENEVTAQQRTELLAAGYTVDTRIVAGDGSGSGDGTWGAYATWADWSQW